MKIHFLLLFICSFSIINAQDVIPFQEEEGIHWGLKNGADIIIEASYHYINNFHEGLAEVKMDNQRGFINKKGEIIVPIKYDYVNNFKDSVAWVYMDHKIGLIDNKGNELTEIKYQDGQKKFYDGMAMVSERKINKNKTKKQSVYNYPRGFINLKGEEVIPPQYDEAYIFSEGLAAVSKNKKWGFINKNNIKIGCGTFLM